MFFSGLLLIALAGGLLVLALRQQQWVETLQQAARIDAKRARAMELGRGDANVVELVGTIECPNPLVAPASQRACVYYEVQVQRQYEVTETITDDQGRRRRQTRVARDTVVDHREHVDFDLCDEAGTLRIEQAGAQYEGLSHSRELFVPADQFEDDHHRDLWPWLPRPRRQPRQRTIGYQCRERILPLTRTLTVIGELQSRRGGDVHMAKGRQPLIVSTRPREALAHDAEQRAARLRWGMMISGAIGMALLIFATLRLLGQWLFGA